MVYAVIKKDGLRNAPGGGGVTVDIHWYERDPEEEPGLSPFLADQDVIPAPDVSQVTEAMLKALLERRRPYAESHLAPPGTPQPRVREMVGRAHVVNAGSPVRAAAEARAERERGR